MSFHVLLLASHQIRETGAFTGGGGDLIDFKTALVELDEVRTGEEWLNGPQSRSTTRKTKLYEDRAAVAGCQVCACIQRAAVQVVASSRNSGSEQRSPVFRVAHGSWKMDINIGKQ